MPASNRITVKLVASIASSPNAILQRIEFPEKAKRASVVYMTIFIYMISYDKVSVQMITQFATIIKPEVE